MTEQELITVFELPNAAIIAPAGHGKTEMIVDLVEHATGKQLLLTHTNAGVDVLEKRLKKRKVPKNKYNISTIAAFCIKWCMAYNQNARFDKTLSPLNGRTESRKYYEQIYRGSKTIFTYNWSGKILQCTYSGVVVDEYQDCTQEQHEIILAINHFLPVRVLGDPMQGIFSFAGPLVDWNNLEFNVVNIATKPWRWSSTNPLLGDYLTEVRKQFLPILSGQKCSVHLESCGGSIKILPPDTFNGYSLLKELKNFSSVLYITQWEQGQLDFCSRMPGIFQVDEKQDCNELFDYAREFDSKSDSELALSVIAFANECATKVNSELKTYRTKLESKNYDFSRIHKYTDFGDLLTSVCHNGSFVSIINVLSWFKTKNIFKMYRSELYAEMIRSLKYANDNKASVFEAANHIRKDTGLQKRYTQFKYLSSRTVLSKGLEFDCVIIDMRVPLSAKDFYVAMTRAMKKIYIISSSEDFQFLS